MGKTIFIFLTAIVLFSGCVSAPEGAVQESRGSIHAQNKYFVIDDAAVAEKLDSVEYKMLINLEDYSPELLWELMKEAAVETGVEIQESDEPMKRNYRRVEYLDSEYGMLKNFGYILRFRHAYDEYEGVDSPANEDDSKYDITIKFRDGDIEKSYNTPLSVGSAFAAIETSPELEADISPYGIKYSRAIKVKPKVKDFGPFADLFEPTLASYATLFPNLLDVGLPVDTVISRVGGLTILEEKVEPAVLVLDCGVEMEVAFSQFYMDGEVLVAEASFDFGTVYETRDAAGNEVEVKMTVEDLRQTEAFYKAILERYDERLNFGWSKTTFVYDTLFPDVGAE